MCHVGERTSSRPYCGREPLALPDLLLLRAAVADGGVATAAGERLAAYAAAAAAAAAAAGRTASGDAPTPLTPA